MRAQLTGTWELSTEHAASSYGQPVLVHRPTGDAYGPADVIKPYPSFGFMRAADAVVRLARTAHLDGEGAALVEAFCGKVAETATGG